jgi:hypothetical protein
MPQLNTFFPEAFWISFAFLVGSMIFFVLAMLQGRGYSVQAAETHASDYAAEIKEGHGGMTAFLWVSFGAMLVWAIIYFWIHAPEFLILIRTI